MEDFRRFMQKRSATTSEEKWNENDTLLPNYSGLDNLEENEDIYDALGQQRTEQTLYYEEEDFDAGQMPNLEEMDEAQEYLGGMTRPVKESAIDLSAVDDDKIDQLRKKVRREGAAFTRTMEDFDIKPLTRFMLPEDIVKENDIAWDWDSLISDIMIHPDIMELTIENDKDDKDDDSKTFEAEIF